MVTPDELDAEADRLEAEITAHRSRIAKLRALAARQRELDRLVQGELLTDSTEATITPHNVRTMTPQHRLAIGRSTVKRFHGQPFYEALVARNMLIGDYCRLRQLPQATVASWMDPSPNGRRIPEDEALFAEHFFGKDLLPATDKSWPHGIRTAKRRAPQ